MSKNTIRLKNGKNGKPEIVRFFNSFSSLQEFKAKDGKLGGVAVPYGKKTQDWRQVSFKMGAFKNLKKTSLFVNHESWDVKSMVGTTEYIDNPLGVMFSALLNMKDRDVIEKIIPLIEMGALEGVSIGAYILKSEDVHDDKGYLIETIITEAEIYELSIVTFQAFEDAKITESLEQENNMTKKNKTENKKVTDKVILSEDKDAPVEQPETKTPETKESEVEESEEEKKRKEGEAESETPKEKEDTSEESESSNDTETEVKSTEESVHAKDEDKVELSNEELRKQVSDKDAEIAELKQNSNNKEKNDCVDKLIALGIVHNAQKDRILKIFTSAVAIKEFYKDVPASYSVEPKGEGAVDVTEDVLKSEQYAKLSKESSLSKEDFEKYDTK